MNPERHFLERVRHRDGERLRAVDFRESLRTESQLRWWHNRSIHRALGIADGLEIRFHAGLVQIDPGTAYDGFGHELVLERQLHMAPPARRERTFVALRAPQPPPVGGGPPESFYSVRSPEPMAVVLGELIPVRPDGWRSHRVHRRRVKPASRPLLASGGTVPGRTAWTAWQDPGSGASGVEVDIDHAAAGFTDAPCVFATLHGDVFGRPTRQFSVLVPRVEAASDRGFTYSLWEAHSAHWLTRSAPTSLLAFARRFLHVEWIAVEPDPEPIAAGGPE